ncbi:MAG: MBL fold metallo-hydrolase [Chloroflexota bacterium]
MELRVKALASGSSGNAFLVQVPGAALLVEAGLPASVLQRRLREQGVASDGLAGILVSHEHSDHAQGAVALARRYGAPIVANRATLDRLGVLAPGKARGSAPADDPPPPADVLASGRTRRVGPFDVTSFRLPHDAAEPVGFLVAHDGWQICIATDLGEACDALSAPVRQADLVILEANHDPVRLRNGYYPAALKQRITGRHGHLSNQQSAEILIQNWQGLPPLALKSVWLAHLSKQNNSQATALETVRTALLAARLSRHVGELAVVGRDRPSLEWRPQCVQRSLF